MEISPEILQNEIKSPKKLCGTVSRLGDYIEDAVVE